MADEYFGPARSFAASGNVIRTCDSDAANVNGVVLSDFKSLNPRTVESEVHADRRTQGGLRIGGGGGAARIQRCCPLWLADSLGKDTPTLRSPAFTDTRNS